MGILHQVIARCIDRSIKLYEQQLAIMGGIDDCHDNIVLLEAILISRYIVHEPLYLVSLVMTRAAHSVGHIALRDTNQATGLPPETVEYLR